MNEGQGTNKEHHFRMTIFDTFPNGVSGALIRHLHVLKNLHEIHKGNTFHHETFVCLKGTNYIVIYIVIGGRP